MRVFISWSLERSKHVALALRDWLPNVIQKVRPFMSEVDIEKGTPGIEMITKELKATDYGIVCLTPENFERPWINYEAGTLSKSIDSRVATYLIDLSPTGFRSPLSGYQATQANSKPDNLKLLKSINAAAGAPLTEAKLEQAFGMWWPQLEEALKSTPPSTAKTPERGADDILTEVLTVVRDLANRVPALSQPKAAPERRQETRSSLSLSDQLIREFAGTSEEAHRLDRAIMTMMETMRQRALSDEPASEAIRKLAESESKKVDEMLVKALREDLHGDRRDPSEGT